jgi:hypothetical protein
VPEHPLVLKPGAFPDAAERFRRVIYRKNEHRLSQYILAFSGMNLCIFQKE